MTILIIIVLVCIAAGTIQSGWVFLLFPVGGGIYYLVKHDKNNKAMDSFFALMFFAGLIAIGFKALG